VAQDRSRILTPADNREPIQQVLDAVEAWVEDADGPEKLVMPLAHQYCTKSLSFNSLKGTDIAKVDTALQAARVSFDV
jgi:hypothetical protein